MMTSPFFEKKPCWVDEQERCASHIELAFSSPTQATSFFLTLLDLGKRSDHKHSISCNYKDSTHFEVDVMASSRAVIHVLRQEVEQTYKHCKDSDQ